MKYLEYFVTENGVPKIQCYKPEDMDMYIPPDPNNSDYAKMMEGVNADPPTNTIEEVDNTE